MGEKEGAGGKRARAVREIPHPIAREAVSGIHRIAGGLLDCACRMFSDSIGSLGGIERGGGTGNRAPQGGGSRGTLPRHAAFRPGVIRRVPSSFRIRRRRRR